MSVLTRIAPTRPSVGLALTSHMRPDELVEALRDDLDDRRIVSKECVPT